MDLRRFFKKRKSGESEILQDIQDLSQPHIESASTPVEHCTVGGDKHEPADTKNSPPESSGHHLDIVSYVRSKTHGTDERRHELLMTTYICPTDWLQLSERPPGIPVIPPCLIGRVNIHHGSHTKVF